MFWDILVDLCVQRGTTPTAVVHKLGIASGSVTQWKKRGSMPRSTTLQKIADYFGVSTDYLLGKEELSATNSFGDRLLFLLRFKNVTKKKLAEDLQIGINSFQYWEKKGIVPNMDTVNRIAEYFDVSVSFLLGLDDSYTCFSTFPQLDFSSKDLASIKVELIEKICRMTESQATSLFMFLRSLDI